MAFNVTTTGESMKPRLKGQANAILLGESFDVPKPSIMASLGIFRSRIAQTDDQTKLV
jgi:hypothetical protein